MLEILEFGVILAVFISFVSLCYLIIKTYRFRKNILHSKPQGKRLRGVVYALGLGMAPWEKESAARHLPTYLAGMTYHIGIFAAIFYLICLLISIPLNPGIMLVLRIFVSAGILSGMGLFIKRATKTQLRKISCPDDFVSNILVDFFIVLALMDSLQSSIRPFFLGIAILMLLYIPIGKIRHCFFFFYSRILFGAFYGRRGVLPPAERQSRI
jgi:nitrate reductase gamma subunit